MLTAVKGYYNGNQIIIDEDVQMAIGQEVIITILDRRRDSQKKIDLSQYMGRGEKMFHTDAQEYVEELRNNDRI